MHLPNAPAPGVTASLAIADYPILCDEDGVRTRVLVDFFPRVNSEVYLDRLDHLPLLTFAAAPHDEILLLLKRVIDVVLATAAVLALSPLMLLIAALIKLTSPGPAIFRQVRRGLNGRRFVFYKFRSMVVNAEELKSGLLHMNRKEIAFKYIDNWSLGLDWKILLLTIPRVLSGRGAY